MAIDETHVAKGRCNDAHVFTAAGPTNPLSGGAKNSPVPSIPSEHIGLMAAWKDSSFVSVGPQLWSPPWGAIHPPRHEFSYALWSISFHDFAIS